MNYHMDQRSSELSLEMPEDYFSSENNALDLIRTQLLGYDEADDPSSSSLILMKPDCSKNKDPSSSLTLEILSEYLSEVSLEGFYWKHERNWCSHCNSFAEIWSNNFAEQTKYSCKSCHKYWTHPLDKIEVPVKNWLDSNGQSPSANTYSDMNDICINIDNPNIVNHIISVHHVMPEYKRSTDSESNLAEVVLGITGQAAFSLLGYSLSSSSSTSPALAFVVGANAVGFIGTLTAILLRRKKRLAGGIAGKLGAIAAASGIVVAMGMFLPEKFVWTCGLACLIPTMAVVFA